MTSNFLRIGLFLTLLSLVISSCNHRADDKMVKWKGLDDTNDIIFLYKKGVTYEEKQDFQNTVLFKPYVKDYGQEHQDGIADLMLGRIISDFDGGTVNFSQTATFEQRERLKKAIKDSSKIYRVYENTVPNQIKGL